MDINMQANIMIPNILYYTSSPYKQIHYDMVICFADDSSQTTVRRRQCVSDLMISYSYVCSSCYFFRKEAVRLTYSVRIREKAHQC